MKGNERYMSDHGVTIPTEEGASARPPPTESSQLEQQQHVIFLAIDVSKPTITLGQGKKKKITEIGISTLATSDLAIGRARGEGEACVVEWFKKIRTRNFKIREWSNIRETDLVLGYEDNFKKELGNSEWISVHNAPKLIASCFGHASPVLDGSSSVNSPPTRISSIGVVVAPEEEKCNIIVVGHRIEKKISELRDIIGFDVTKLGNVITKKGLDVMDMFRALQQNPKTRTLCSLFHELDKPIQTKANPVSFSFFGWCLGKRKNRIKQRDVTPPWASPKPMIYCLCLLLLFPFFLLLNPKVLAYFFIHAACQAKPPFLCCFNSQDAFPAKKKNNRFMKKTFLNLLSSIFSIILGKAA